MSVTRGFKYRGLVNSILLLCILAMVGISIFVYHADALSLLLFLAFFILYIQVPGLLILSLLKVDPGHISSRLLLSALSGWMLLIAEYAVCEILSFDVILFALGPFLSGIYVHDVNKGHANNPLKSFRFSKLSPALMLFVALTLLYVLLTTQYKYLAPAAGGDVFASIDKVFQMGLVDSLADGYPLVNPWLAGRIVHYHIFAQLMYAVPVKLFGLTADFLIISCGPYVLTYILCLAFYSMFRHFCHRKGLAGIYSLCVLLSYMFVAKEPTASYAFRIIFTNDNYGGYGLASAIGFIIALDLYMTEEKRLNAEGLTRLALPLLILVLTTGLKAPIGLILSGAVIGTYLLGLILKKYRLADAIPVGIMSVAFFIVYKLLLDSNGTQAGNGNSIFGFGSLIKMCFWHKPVIDQLTAWGIPSPARLLVVVFVYFAFFFSCFFIPMAFGYLRELVLVIRGIKEYRFALVGVYAATLLGTFFSLIMRYTGHSQIYFGIVATAFAPLIAILFLEETLGKDFDTSKFMRVIGKLSLGVFMVTLVISTVLFGMNLEKCYRSALKNASVDAKHSMYRSMSHDEYEAMMWLKENTSEDDLIATQMYRSVSNEHYNVKNRWVNTHFFYAAYSDRNFYIEGTGFSLGEGEWQTRAEYIEKNNRLFDINNPNRGSDADAIDVDYVVVTKKLRKEKDYVPVGDLSNSDYELVFTNNDIDIYEVI